MSTNPKTPLRKYQLFFLIVGLVCVAAVVTNLVLRQGPAHDATVESDLMTISGSIDSFLAVQSFTPPKLPENLKQLTDLPPGVQRRLNNYDYKQLTPLQYQLCATFAETVEKGVRRSYEIGNEKPDTSVHQKGRQCFTYTVRTSLNPSFLRR